MNLEYLDQNNSSVNKTLGPVLGPAETGGKTPSDYNGIRIWYLS